MHISIDRQDVSLEDAVIPVLDHGFLFGDSVYEVVRTWRGRLLFCPEHLTRLRNSAAGIGLPIPLSDEEFTAEIRRMHECGDDGESYVRIIVTRGTGELDLGTSTCTEQRVIVIQKPLKIWPEELYTKGGKLSLVSVVRNQRETTDPAFKTGNYLNNVLAIDEARKSGATEAVMLNRDGDVTECTTSNIFWVADGTVYTPSLEAGILPGITRGQVLEACTDEDIAVETGHYTADELMDADEIFITSTTKDVMPITQIDHARVADGRLGSMTKRLMEAYCRRCEASVG